MRRRGDFSRLLDVKRLIDRSEAETAAPEGERECAGDAVDASRAATEPFRHPVPIDPTAPWTGLRSFFLLVIKARARDLFLFRACHTMRALFRACHSGQTLLFLKLEL